MEKASLVSFEILPEIALRFCLIVTSLTTSLKNSLKSAKSFGVATLLSLREFAIISGVLKFPWLFASAI